MKFIECKGTPSQIGETVGESLRDEIRLYESMVEQQYKNKNFDARLKVFRRELINRQPRVYEEIAGMARGANLPEETILRINIEPYPNELGIKIDNCTNIMFTGGPDGPIFGKNNDGGPNHLPFYMKKVIPDEGIPLITISFAGLVFTTDAMNAEGVAVGHSSVGSVFTQSDLHPNIRLWAYEGMQKARNTREFVRHMCSSPLRGKGYSHVCIDKSGDVCSLEAACPLMQVREPKKDAHGICCVNHYQLPTLLNADRRPPEGKKNSYDRMHYLESVFNLETIFDLSLMKKMLTYHGTPGAVCRHSDQESEYADTEYSMIGLPAQGKWLYRSGHPCKGEYSEMFI